MKKITPEEYLALALKLSEGTTPSPEELVVEGHVNLFSWADREKIVALPRAEILGDLRAQNCTSLEKVECSVRGSANLNGSGVRIFCASAGVDGPLYMAGCHRLEKLTGWVSGGVDLTESSIVSLGEEFSCRGTLQVDCCKKLTLLDCHVGGDLSAERSGLSAFGPNFCCRGDLKLWHCMNLKKLGNLSPAPRDVFLGSSGVEEIGLGFHCTGALMLRDVEHLISLSGSISENLDLDGGSALESIKNLTVGGEMSVSDCPRLRTVDFKASSAKFARCAMETLPASSASDELLVRHCENFSSMGGRWAGDVTLSDLSSLRMTSENFECSGCLLIRSCVNLESLEGKIGGVATLSQVPKLKNLRPSLKVGQNLVLACPDSQLSSIACHVDGDLIVMGCAGKFATEAPMRVGGNALFHGASGLSRLSGHVAGNAVLREGSGPEVIGADFECGGDLLVSGCPSLKVVNCRVGGKVVLDRTGLVKTGPAFACSGSLKLTGDFGLLREMRGYVGGGLDFPVKALVSSGVKIMLSGSGGDECGGSNRDHGDGLTSNEGSRPIPPATRGRIPPVTSSSSPTRLLA